MDNRHDGVTFWILLRRLIYVALFIIILIIVSIDSSLLQVPGKADTTKTPSLKPPMKQPAPHSQYTFVQGHSQRGLVSPEAN